MRQSPYCANGAAYPQLQPNGKLEDCAFHGHKSDVYAPLR